MQLGLQRSDRVAVAALNCHRHLELHQAIPAAGLVLVPLNTRHVEAEPRDALANSGARVLVTDRDPGPLASLVEHVVRLDTGEYDALLADSPERWGEAVHAVAVPRSSVTVDELLAHCRELVAGYQVPKVVDVTDVPLPTSGAGKVLKRQLRDPRWAGRDSAI